MTTWEQRVLRWLKPSGFFPGLVLGFVACCIAGRKAPGMLPIADFHRFHRFLSPESLYYPTALQVRALARHELPKDKIAVVIGGSSVMQGCGQNAAQLWSRQLQQELGDDFRIFNLATVGGAPGEYGQVAAEILARDGRKVIFVCDCAMHLFAVGPDGNRRVYRYVLHDARSRSLLLPSLERERELQRLAGERRAETDQDEFAIQTGANRWLSFNDLWHVIGYERFFTVWNSKGRAEPWQARRNKQDPWVQFAVNDNRKPRGLAAFREMMAPYGEDDWSRVTKQVRTTIPEDLRPRTIVVVTRFNPEYGLALELETPHFVEQYHRKLQAGVAALRTGGVQAVESCVTLDAGDYLDLNHLLPSGGDKLARELAPTIRETAHRLGYLSNHWASRADASRGSIGRDRVND